MAHRNIYLTPMQERVLAEALSRYNQHLEQLLDAPSRSDTVKTEINADRRTLRELDRLLCADKE